MDTNKKDMFPNFVLMDLYGLSKWEERQDGTFIVDPEYIEEWKHKHGAK